MDGANQRRCPMCRKSKDSNTTHFQLARDGLSVNCLECLVARRKRHSQKKGSSHNKENRPTSDSQDSDPDEEDEPENLSALSEIKIDAFLEAITAVEDLHSFTARVDVSSFMTNDLKERANTLAKGIWGRLNYRFV